MFDLDTSECLVFPEITGDQVVEFRKRIGLSQREFAVEFDIPLGTLRRWEQEQSSPSKSRLELFELRVKSMLKKKATSHATSV